MMCGRLHNYNCASKIHILRLIFLLYLEPSKFTETPSNHEFNGEIVHIGNPDNPTCYICVNCSVTGSPAPVVTWQYQLNGMADFSCIITNQSDASSPYFVKDNGQVMFNFTVNIVINSLTEVMFQ